MEWSARCNNDLLVVLTKGLISPPINFNNFVYNVFSWPPNYLKYTLPSSLAAMSTTDKKLSQKRAVFIGLIVSAYSYSFLIISDKFSGLFKPFEDIQSLKIDDFVFMGMLGFGLIISTILSTYILGNATGRLCTKGVYVGRNFIEKVKYYFDTIIIKAIRSYINIIKDHWL